MNILEIKSIRWKNVHFAPESEATIPFLSINKAKAHSRTLGGAGKVIAAKDASHFTKVKKEAIAAHVAERARLEEIAQAKEKANG